jgi:hypothetical protein
MYSIPVTTQSWCVFGTLAYGAAASDTMAANCYSNVALSNLTASEMPTNAQNFRAEVVGLGYTGAGSLSACLGHTVMNSAGVSSGSLYGLKGQIDNLAGTITAGTAVDGCLGANAADQTVTAFTGFAASAPSNAGTVTSYTGLSVGVPDGTVTNAYGVVVGAIAGGTVSRGVSSALTAGSGKHNLYCSGTAVNYLAGALRCGADTDFGVKVGSSDGFAATVQGSSPDGVASTGTFWFTATELKYRIGTGTVMTVTAS